MALGASAGHCAVLVPVSEGLFRAGEVAGIDAMDHGEIHRFDNGFIQVHDGIVQQLDDVLAAMGMPISS